jgi:hypothetical protein
MVQKFGHFMCRKRAERVMADFESFCKHFLHAAVGKQALSIFQHLQASIRRRADKSARQRVNVRNNK